MLHACADLRLRSSPQSQAERHVFEYRHMRIKRIILEHHGDVTILGWHVIDDVAADEDLAGGDLFEPRNHTQRRALSAAGGSHKDDEFVVRNVKADIAHRLDLVEALHHVAQRYLSHRSPLGRAGGQACDVVGPAIGQDFVLRWIAGYMIRAPRQAARPSHAALFRVLVWVLHQSPRSHWQNNEPHRNWWPAGQRNPSSLAPRLRRIH